jgi:hypothetical protein
MAGRVLAVEPKAFRVLLLLLRNPQKLISKEELLNSVWGDTAVTEGSLTGCIWILRRALGDDVNQPHFIETVPTVGYRFMWRVEVSEAVSGEMQSPDRANGAIGGWCRDRGESGDRGFSIGWPGGERLRIGPFDSVLRVLELDNHQLTTVPASEAMWSPRWSPNGRFIAALHDGPTGGIRIFDVETERWSEMKRTDVSGFESWSSDSKFLYILRLWKDDPGVFRVRVADGAEERVVDLKGFRHTGTFTMWMGLDATDTPMLVRDVGTEDIYALTLEQK